MARLSDRERTGRRGIPPTRDEALEDTARTSADPGTNGVALRDGADSALAAPDVDVPSRLPHVIESFGNREFRWFFISMLGQMAAMNMQMFLRPYLAFVLTGSYAVLGLIGLANALPMGVLLMFGGVAADRLPKRTVIQAGQVLSLLNALGLAALWFTGNMGIEWLVVSSVAHGMVMGLTQPARQAMLPELVGVDRMMNAVSLNMAGMNTMRLIAPAGGAFIVSALGFGWAFIAMTVAFAFSIYAQGRVTWTPANAPRAAGMSLRQTSATGIRDTVEGFRYVVREHRMAALLVLVFASSIFGMPYQFLLSGYVADTFFDNAEDAAQLVGLLMSASAAGALLGAFGLAGIPNRNRGWLLLIGGVVLGGSLFAFAQTSNAWIAGVLIIFVGVGSTMRQALSQGLLHTHVENAYRGRVMSLFMLQMSTMQVSTFVAGITAEFIGIQATFAALGVMLVIFTILYGAFVPSIRRMQ